MQLQLLLQVQQQLLLYQLLSIILLLLLLLLLLLGLVPRIRSCQYRSCDGDSKPTVSESASTAREVFFGGMQ